MKAIMLRSLLQIVRRPIYWTGIFLLPLFCMLFMTSELEEGLPIKVHSAVIDHDGSTLSRKVTQTLAGMEMIDVREVCTSYTEARHLMQEGKIYGFFMIPDNFERDVLAGRAPSLTFYTNTSYYVPALLLFKTFKTVATYTKAGIAVEVASEAGAGSDMASAMVPVNIGVRGLGNPGLNYGIYLCNSFVPGIFQLMIMLMTCLSLGQEIKYGYSRKVLAMGGGNILKVIAGKLLPQTLIWWVLIIMMMSWLFGWMGYPMHGSWFWMTLNELLFVLASQALGVFFFGVIPSLRMSLSIAALIGILTLSIAAFSFPLESMYGSISIFSWILPARYNFLIYVDQALNGRDIFYSRWWFVCYIFIILASLLPVWRIKKAYARQVYAP